MISRITHRMTSKAIKVLIIDDFESDRLSYKRYLKADDSYSYRFIDAEDSAEGIALARTHQPDVIFLDYRLPDSEGLETLVQLRQQHPGGFPAIVMLTGQGDEETAVGAIKAGAADYLVKNRLTSPKLIAVLHRVLSQQQLKIELDRSQRRRQLIADSALRIHKATGLQTTLMTAVEDIQQVLGCDTVGIYKIDADGCGSVAHAISGGQSTNELTSASCPIHEYKKPVTLAAGNGVGAQLSVPIRLSPDSDVDCQCCPAWGLLVATYAAAATPALEDIDILSEISVQLGISIQQAALLEQLQGELAERRKVEQNLKQAQKSLEKVNQDLELRIQQRTALLVRANRQLELEVEHRCSVEAALREQENQLRLFVKYTPAAIAMLDRNICYMVHSDRWLDDYGLGNQAIVGRCHYEVFPEIPDRWKDDHRRCLAGETFSSEEDSFTRDNGEVEWLRWELRPWYTATGDIGGLVMLTEFITEKKRHEQQLAKLNAELQRSNQELEQFAYVASHDLREPLRKVRSYSDLLVRRYDGQLDDRADKYIGYITDGAMRMMTLINDLLEFSRVGRGELTIKPYPLEQVLEQVISDLQPQMEDTEAQIHIPLSLPVVQGNDVLLRQLLQNLIGNSLKYRGDDPPRILVDAVPAGAFWQISITDNGIGIAPEFAERIFVVFQRLHIREAYEGTGIGLAVCKRIVEHHGGKIWVDSQLGEGATFHFTLPRSQ